ncbi:nitrite reductase (NAD(P)H) small subunit [Streptomyces carminius]|uniref:Nitrite reductase (NAD(P)H) small subunit n=1 Tax=Streptomyces carminius TaxID=2665496 RepID=A0A2M8LQV4_9ACTN|nr:nitrite reductase small subunit NirD [Streptomyces carminius]PJE94335.1 nitrite reductase (NAD(P)H) small subunit [Streptomyces carminius]
MTTAPTFEATVTTPEDLLAAAPAAAAAAAGPRVEVRTAGGWAPVCGLSDLLPGRGVAALLPDGGQLAVFQDRAGRTYAVGNRDPFTGAYVLSRGLLGSAGDRAFVASPLLKQRFDLATGRCLDDESVAVPVYPVRTR